MDVESTVDKGKLESLVALKDDFLSLYGIPVHQLQDERFAPDNGDGGHVHMLVIWPNGSLEDRSLSGDEIDDLCNGLPEDDESVLRIFALELHPVPCKTRPWYIHAVSLRQDALKKLLDHFNVSAAFLPHFFRAGAAVGWRHVNTDPVDVTIQERESPKRTDHHHIWYSMDLPRDDFYRDPNVRDVDIEVYSIVRPTTSGYHQTLFILQPPAAVLEDISNPARRQRLIEVPYRIHTNIMETALGRWAEMINKMSSDMIIGYMSRYSGARERFNATEIADLYHHMYQAEHQLVKIMQVHYNIKNLREEFERMMVSDPSVISVLGDVTYLERQARVLEKKYVHLRTQLHNLMELNYHLLNYQTASDLRDLSDKARKDGVTIKTLGLIAAVSLPTTITASLCGTNFVFYDSESQTIRVVKEVWMLLVICGALTLVSVITYILCNSSMRLWGSKKDEDSVSEQRRQYAPFWRS